MRMGKDVYVEFWRLKPTSDPAVKKAMPAVGSNSVFYPDKRMSLYRIGEEAQRRGKLLGFHGYMIRSGPMNRPEDRDLLDSVREIE